MSVLQSGITKSLAEAYTIDQSLRFTRADQSYLERTNGTPTDGKKLTASVWVKGPSTVGGGVMLEARSTDWDWWGIDAGVSQAHPEMRCYLYGAQSRADGADVKSYPYYRDPSAWYHYMLVIDTTLAAADDRIKFYVNGEAVSTNVIQSVDQNEVTPAFNESGTVQSIQDNDNGSAIDYLSEYHFIDGQALTPSDFGETSGVTNQWIPIEYTGTYGNNGFYQSYGTPHNTVAFTSAGANTWTCPAGVTSVEILTVAGGGGGAGSDSGNESAGAGGGGGVVHNSSYTTVPGVVYDITVGVGGVKGFPNQSGSSNHPDKRDGGDGADSVFNVNAEGSGATVTAVGGGAGGASGGWDGGSGGGNGRGMGTNGDATQTDSGGGTGYGNDGGDATGSGGGGGAGGVGAGNGAGGNGGAGQLFSNFTDYGVSGYFAGGGGGGSASGGGTGGSGGGGAGGGEATDGTNGTANTGGGGGGGPSAGSYGGVGGDGVVLIRIDGGLGTDSSGNGNNYTVTNLVATDQMLDSPTNNFATLNPLYVNSLSPVSFSEGNLFWEQTSSAHTPAASTIAVGSGKWYFECRATSGDSGKWWWGMADAASIYEVASGANLDWGDFASGTFGGDNIALYYNDVKKNGSVVQDECFGTDISDGDICMLAMDCENGKVWFGKNSIWNNGDPQDGPTGGRQSTTLNASYEDATFDVTKDYYMGVGAENSEWCANYGQDSSFAGTETAQGNSDSNEIGDFYYAPPTDFLTLCTSNLSAPEIKKPGDNFNTVLWSGDDTDPHAITGVGFQPDFLWIKSRSATKWHQQLDVTRGVTKQLFSNEPDAETTNTDKVKSFDTDGFTLGTRDEVNGSGETYVGWNWLAGTAPTTDNVAGAGATPTAGSVKIDGSNLGSALAGTIAATRLSANTTNGFSIISYTGTGVSATIAHGLGQAPEWFVIKTRDASRNWLVYNKPLGATYHLILDGTNAANTSSSYFNDTDPDASVITLGTDSLVNDTEDYVAYCFSSREGYSKVGSYEGNGDADGSFVYTGFRPAFLLMKNVDSTESWWMIDNKRDTYNPEAKHIRPNDSTAEYDATVADFVSNGFKFRDSDAAWNGSASYIYLAFANYPFKYSPAR